MFKKVIVVFFLIFSAHLGFATDLSFKEKSPIDRLYNESYQGIEQLREEQKFKFDPKLKIAQKDRSYQSLLEQRDEDENPSSIIYVLVISTQVRLAVRGIYRGWTTHESFNRC
ncbi:Uncharacterised protein [Providencia alcalifaciens]|nr:Uncharacterised protein [Providencia alcalifaciens]